MDEIEPSDDVSNAIAPVDQQEDESDLLRSDSALRFDAAISSTDWTTETVISQLKKGNIFLDPDFQRRDAWTQVRKSQYIESLILGIPTPQIILAERKEKRGSYIVIDGKQRLLSLRQFASEDQEFKSFPLKGLNARQDLNGKTYNEFNGGLFADSAPDFENATIRTVVIKSWPNEDFLYEVFLRINSGSVQLSPQELRQALRPGPFTSELNKFAINSIVVREMLGLKHPDFRMRDNELVLRYIASRFFLKSYNGNLKQFLDDATAYFNSNWHDVDRDFFNAVCDLEAAILATKKIFGKNAFKKWNGYYFESRINRAVFDVMTYFFSNSYIVERCLDKREIVVEAFKTVCEDWRFSTAVSGTTKSIDAVQRRYALWARQLAELSGLPIESPLGEPLD